MFLYENWSLHMDVIRFAKRKYWEFQRYLYDLQDVSGHIGYMTFDIRDPEEHAKAYKAIEDEMNRRYAFYERKIKENSPQRHRKRRSRRKKYYKI